MLSRTLLRGAAAAAGAALAAPFNRGRYRLFANSLVDYSARTIALMQRSVVIDMLGVFTLDFPLQARWAKAPETFTAKEFEKSKSSCIYGLPPRGRHRRDERVRPGSSVLRRMEPFIAGSDQHLLRIDSPADFDRIKASARSASSSASRTPSISVGLTTSMRSMASASASRSSPTTGATSSATARPSGAMRDSATLACRSSNG